MTGLRAIMVCVDYADLLSITLPYNRHHFDEVMVVTASRDDATLLAADRCGARTFQTNAFYDNDASFNKWKALEEGLEYFGRHGWLCLMDADVLWPKELKMWIDAERACFDPSNGQPGAAFKKGSLITPLRRMHEPLCVPPEDQWKKYPIHRNVAEWAGYSQIFHADDPVLGPAPWHETNWKHAGGADSFFQRKWAAANKVRPPFEVLHLGPAGQNWTGRVTPYVDGTEPEGAGLRKTVLNQFMRDRQRKRGMPEQQKFSHEKLG